MADDAVGIHEAPTIFIVFTMASVGLSAIQKKGKKDQRDSVRPSADFTHAAMLKQKLLCTGSKFLCLGSIIG